MKLASSFALLAGQLLSTAQGAAAQGLVPVELAGTCSTSGIGTAFLEDHEAERIATPECDRAVLIGDASLSVLRSGDATPLVMFSGRSRGGRHFTVELVRLGAQPVRETIAGRCLPAHRSFICYAVFNEGEARKGIALRFDIGEETPR